MSTKMKIGIWVVVLILVAGGAVLFSSRTSASNTVNLASLNANDATAYRYEVLARYYTDHPANAVNLASLNANDATAYRYEVLARYYADHPANSVNLAGLNTSDATAYRYEVLARYYAQRPNATR